MHQEIWEESTRLMASTLGHQVMDLADSRVFWDEDFLEMVYDPDSLQDLELVVFLLKELCFGSYTDQSPFKLDVFLRSQLDRTPIDPEAIQKEFISYTGRSHIDKTISELNKATTIDWLLHSYTYCGPSFYEPMILALPKQPIQVHAGDTLELEIAGISDWALGGRQNEMLASPFIEPQNRNTGLLRFPVPENAKPGQVIRPAFDVYFEDWLSGDTLRFENILEIPLKIIQLD